MAEKVTSLTEEEISANRERFLDLVQGITREGMNKDALINKLAHSDFFEAPASTKYHGSFKGGLCYHCLNVYDNLEKLVKVQYPDTVDEEGNPVSTSPISEDSIRITALFHDFSKMNFYQPEVRNKKEYSPFGKKQDEMGRFDWVAVAGYGVKDLSERFVYGNHETNAVFMITKFIPTITVDESTAILHHMGGAGKDSSEEIPAVFGTYPLAILLHLADMMSTFLTEDNCRE